MKQNVHKVERIVRVIIGISLVAMAFIGPANLWFLLGIIPLATGLLGWCPPYAIFGINTCDLGKKNNSIKH